FFYQGLELEIAPALAARLDERVHLLAGFIDPAGLNHTRKQQSIGLGLQDIARVELFFKLQQLRGSLETLIVFLLQVIKPDRRIHADVGVFQFKRTAQLAGQLEANAVQRETCIELFQLKGSPRKDKGAVIIQGLRFFLG